MKPKKQFRISFNAPAVLTFALICLLAQVLNMLTHGGSNTVLFSVHRSSFLDPLAYVRCITHVFGHADWDHLLGNMMYLLILGPMLEEKYGTSNIVFVMLATALVTGITSLIFLPAATLCGASGVVFAFILLASITTTQGDAIPVTFILVALLYLGQQLYSCFTSSSNISYMAHIVGGIIGSILGFVMEKNNMSRYRRGRHA